ncbi:MAG: FAD-dependent thymidylate synthase, partial [Pseudomonadota bacterium]
SKHRMEDEMTSYDMFPDPLIQELIEETEQRLAHAVKLAWITPNAEDVLLYIAKVSNPAKQSEPAPHLLRYLIEHDHWSPFEMINICFEVNTTRDIGRQFLRHWTMRAQEFSQRYQDVSVLGGPIYREARMQHPTNRQASLPCDDPALEAWWYNEQMAVWNRAKLAYDQALEKGIAKEVARVVQPEGMTPSRLYFNAPLRTALFVTHIRSKEHGAQDEAVRVADGLRALLAEHMPATVEAFTAWREAHS